MFVSVEELLARTGSVLDEWGAVDWAACDPGPVSVAAVGLLKAADRLQALAVLAVAEHERRGGVARDGDASVGDWASRQTKSSRDAGRRISTRSKRLGGAAKTGQAAADGTLSVEQAERLAAARTAENADQFDQREQELIAAAAPSLDDAIKTAEDFRTETGETPADRAARLWKRRSAACWNDEDGMTQGRQSLAGDGGAAWRATFDAFVDREFRRSAPDDRRTNAHKRADAAIAMAMAAQSTLASDEPRWAARATVQVAVRYEDLIAQLESDWAGEDTRTGIPLAGTTINGICCDADIIRLVTKGDSIPIDVGRKTRTIPTATRRAVLARDGGCTYPGCHHHDGLQVHHIKHWGHLGATDLHNLVTLCWRHHQALHGGGWHLRLDPDTQRSIWTSPEGRQLIGQRRGKAPPTPAAA